MANIRLTKQFSFEMAHALEGYDGKCKHIHGHSYLLFVTVIGRPVDDFHNPKYGMVMDFGDLKRIVETHVINRLDHTLLLRKDAPLLEELTQQYGRVERVDYQPTCENLIAEIAETLRRYLPQSVKLHSLRLHETATSYAEWYAEDN